MSSDSSAKPLEAEHLLAEYLEKTPPITLGRVDCCGSSRSFYCPICCRVLVPREEWPDDIRNGKLRLPFDVDIVLGQKERRTCATGIQLVAISAALEESFGPGGFGDSVGRGAVYMDGTSNSVSASRNTQARGPQDRVRLKGQFCGSATLYSFDEDNVPLYNSEKLKNTYVLYPEKGSVPIFSVGKIDRLIVLDIKWSRKSGKSDARFKFLPRVHLDSPPLKSHFWRWHSEGEGMLSTIEAIYYAAMEARSDFNDDERERWIHIMWLFALQHSIIKKRSELEKRTVPFSNEGKSDRRRLRQLHSDHPFKKKAIEAVDD
eukprot:scaffold721_cov131-Cylindrotheca_fusiformis.AAC.77